MADNNGMRIAGYDPQTGEPIWEAEPTVEPERKIKGYNPQTGQPIYEEEPQPEPERKIKGYDPQTGQPIYEEEPQPEPERKIKGYNPQTGQPIYEEEPQPEPERKIKGYDPQTGQPIYENGAERRKPGGLPLWLKFAIIGGGIVLAGIVVLLCLLLPARSAVTRALKATVQDFAEVSSRIADESGFTGTALPLLQKDFSIDAEVEIAELPGGMYVDALEGSGIVLDVNYDRGKRLSNLEVEMALGGMANLNALLFSDGATIVAALPDISDTTVSMSTQDIFGQLADAGVVDRDLADIELDINLFPDGKGELEPQQILDRFMKFARKDISAALKEIEIEKDGSERREAFGKNTECAKYVVTIPDRVVHMLGKTLVDFIAQDEALLAIMEPIAESNGTDLKDNLEELAEDLEDSWEEDITADLYIKNGRVVCLETEIDGNEIELELLGKGNVCEEIKLADDYAFALHYTSEMEGDTLVVRTKLSTYSQDMDQRISYNTRTGELEMSIGDGYTEIDMEAMAGVSSGAFNISDGLVSISFYDGALEIEFAMSIHKLDGVTEPEGFPVDIFELSERNREELLEELLGGLGAMASPW